MSCSSGLGGGLNRTLFQFVLFRCSSTILPYSGSSSIFSQPTMKSRTVRKPRCLTSSSSTLRPSRKASFRVISIMCLLRGKARSLYSGRFQSTSLRYWLMLEYRLLGINESLPTRRYSQVRSSTAAEMISHRVSVPSSLPLAMGVPAERARKRGEMTASWSQRQRACLMFLVRQVVWRQHMPIPKAMASIQTSPGKGSQAEIESRSVCVSWNKGTRISTLDFLRSLMFLVRVGKRGCAEMTASSKNRLWLTALARRGLGSVPKKGSAGMVRIRQHVSSLKCSYRLSMSSKTSQMDSVDMQGLLGMVSIIQRPYYSWVWTYSLGSFSGRYSRGGSRFIMWPSISSPHTVTEQSLTLIQPWKRRSRLRNCRTALSFSLSCSSPSRSMPSGFPKSQRKPILLIERRMFKIILVLAYYTQVIKIDRQVSPVVRHKPGYLICNMRQAPLCSYSPNISNQQIYCRLVMSLSKVSSFEEQFDLVGPMDPSLRESRRHYQVIDTINVIEFRTKEDEAKLMKSLQVLAKDTKDHEQKLRVYRKHLQLRLELNQEQWKTKIVQMLDEFQKLKDNLDLSKLIHLLALKELRLKTRVMAALIKRRGERVGLRLKQEELRRCLLGRLLGILCQGEERDNILQFTEGVVDKRNKQEDFNQLVLKFMRNNLERAKKLASERQEFVYKQVVPPELTNDLVVQIHVPPTKGVRDLSVIRANYKQKKKAKRRKVRPPRKIIIEAEHLLAAAQAAGDPVEIKVVLEPDRKRVPSPSPQRVQFDHDHEEQNHNAGYRSKLVLDQDSAQNNYSPYGDAEYWAPRNL